MGLRAEESSVVLWLRVALRPRLVDTARTDSGGRMSQREEGRSCPRCERLLPTRERNGGDGLTLVWQCSCGWAAARTVSRDVAFQQRRDQDSNRRVEPGTPAVRK